jgi:hypothetical protein
MNGDPFRIFSNQAEKKGISDRALKGGFENVGD